MDLNSNIINWFEIPVQDMDRAKKFYETIFNINLQEENMMGMQMAFFPVEPTSGKVAGGLCKSDFHKTSSDGVVIYFNGNPDLSNALNNVETAGGKIIMPKTQITPEIGFMAFFFDSEGNRIALHSQK